MSPVHVINSSRQDSGVHDLRQCNEFHHRDLGHGFHVRTKINGVSASDVYLFSF